MGTYYAHVMEHISQKARQMVQFEIAGIIQQAQASANTGKIDPQAAQAQIAKVQQDMQNPAEMEKLISMQTEQLITEVMPQMMPQGNSPMDDPLVQIRMQELDLKQKDLQRKTEEDQGQMLVELQKMEQRATTDAARIESQEEIADKRNEVNRERIDVQRDKMNRG